MIADAALEAKARRCWMNMKRRCYDESSHAYSDYGGRGIAICERWLSSYAFFRKDMGPPPTAEHSIERNDNDGDYEPENCRWATKPEQARNKRTTVMLPYRGVLVRACDFARETGIPQNYVFCQVRYHQRTGEEILAVREKNRATVEARARFKYPDRKWAPGRKAPLRWYPKKEKRTWAALPAERAAPLNRRAAGGIGGQGARSTWALATDTVDVHGHGYARHRQGHEKHRGRDGRS